MKQDEVVRFVIENYRDISELNEAVDHAEEVFDEYLPIWKNEIIKELQTKLKDFEWTGRVSSGEDGIYLWSQEWGYLKKKKRGVFCVEIWTLSINEIYTGDFDIYIGGAEKCRELKTWWKRCREKEGELCKHDVTLYEEKEYLLYLKVPDVTLEGVLEDPNSLVKASVDTIIKLIKTCEKVVGFPKFGPEVKKPAG